MNRKAMLAERARIQALRGHLSGRSSANPSTLAQSYGLPEPSVSRLMREMGVTAI